MNLGEKLKIYRMENKIVQGDIAKRMGVSRNLISDVERGRIKGTVEFIAKLAEATNTNIAYWTDDINSNDIKYNQYEALDVLINSFIETGLVGEDGKLNEIAQKLVINVLEKEIALKIKNRGDR